MLRPFEPPSWLPCRFNMPEAWIRVRRYARLPFTILLKAGLNALTQQKAAEPGHSCMTSWAMRAWRIAAAAVCEADR